MPIKVAGNWRGFPLCNSRPLASPYVVAIHFSYCNSLLFNANATVGMINNFSFLYFYGFVPSLCVFSYKAVLFVTVS